MARSMTGFGRTTVDYEGEQIGIEVSGVNHRFFECGLRLPPCWGALEPSLREVVKPEVARGKVNISIRREYGPAGRIRVRLDEDAAAGYLAGAARLAEMTGAAPGGALTVDRLAVLDGVFVHADEDADLDAVFAVLAEGLRTALAAFNAARESEAAALLRDMSARFDAMAVAAARVEARAPELQRHYADRLRVRMRELCADPALKEERIAIEAAVMADRMDVTEEIVRLRAHLDHGRALFVSAEPIGRDLNFLLQEMQREINTMGSKLRDIEGSREVLWLKSELEKLREQIQNIE